MNQDAVEAPITRFKSNQTLGLQALNFTTPFIDEDKTDFPNGKTANGHINKRRKRVDHYTESGRERERNRFGTK